MADSFVGYISLGWPSWCFRIWMHCSRILWLSEFWLKSQLLLWWLPIVCTHGLGLLLLLFIHGVLTDTVWGFSFLVLSVQSSLCSCICKGASFFGFWKLSFLIFMKIWSIPLTWDPSTMPVIWRFCLFMVFYVFCMFLSFIIFSFSYSFLILSRSYTLSSRPDNLSLAWFILLVRVSFDFSGWIIGLFQSIFISSLVLANVCISLLNSVFRFWILFVISINLMFAFSWALRIHLFSLNSFPLLLLDLLCAFFKHIEFFEVCDCYFKWCVPGLI